jgi:hypothetical protein
MRLELAGFFAEVVLDEKGPGDDEGSGDFRSEFEELEALEEPEEGDQEDKDEAEKIVEILGDEFF